jgi:hypothetical protein
MSTPQTIAPVTHRFPTAHAYEGDPGGARRLGGEKGRGMTKRIALLSALLTFVFSAVAEAGLVINGGMFGVSLGSTMKQVRLKLGRPNEVDHRGGTIAWSYDSRGLVIDFKENRVHDLSTDGFAQRSASGVGVGSTLTAVMRLVPRVHCSPRFQATQGFECISRSAHASTDFHVTSRRGLVQSVLITREP